MPEYTLQSDHASVIAIDQHARSVTLCALDLAAGETRTGRLTGCPSAQQVLDWASWAAEPRRFVYESGPCGFQLARDLLALGQRCDVIAVTSIPRSTSDKQRKDDRRDAESLLSAVTAQSSKCRAVYIPSEEAEAARDLVRTYYDLVLAMKRLKMQFSAMLLRHGHVWDERTAAGNLKGTWTRDYIAWASSLELGQPAANRALKVYLEDVLTSVKRCQQVKAECLELSEAPRFKPYVDALSRLKGVDRITALTYVATMDDFLALRKRPQRLLLLRPHPGAPRQRREDRAQRQDNQGGRHRRAQGRRGGACQPPQLQRPAQVAAQGVRGLQRRGG